MKKIKFVLFVLLLLLPTSAMAQAENTVFNFQFQAEGKFDKQITKDDLMSYYVVPFEGKTAHQLYEEVLSHIADLYKTPDRVTEKTADRTIIVNGYAGELSVFTDLFGGTSIASLGYSIELQFKDGKIRINPPLISTLTIKSSSGTNTYRGDSYDFLNGATFILSSEEATNKFNNYINTLVSAIVYGLP